MCYGGHVSYKAAASIAWVREQDVLRLEGLGAKVDTHFYPKNKVPIVLKRGADYPIIEARFDMIAPYFLAQHREAKTIAEIEKLKNSTKKDERGRQISYPTWNARAESIHDKVTFAAPWNANQRAVIPITSFYERPNERDTPPEFKNKEFQVFLSRVTWLGVIWERVELGGEELYSFAIPTMPSDGHKIMREIHHIRMPTLLTEAEALEWIDPTVGADRAFKLIDHYPEDEITIQEKPREPRNPKAT
jgi:putative SOS response-associated peptidase YedK